MKNVRTKTIFMLITLIGAVIFSGAVSAADYNDSYAIGQNVTQNALNDTSLALNQSDKNLVITTAGSAKLNNQTTERSLEGVVNGTSNLSEGQKITYGNGNLVQINDPFGALYYAFVSKSTSGALTAEKYTVTYQNGFYTIQVSDPVLISGDLTQSQWDYARQQLGDNYLFSIASIANAWANGASIDLLAITQGTGKITPGVISGYTETKSFINQYPNNSSQQYIILTVPGGYDDDGPIYFMPWNYNYVATNGVNPLESAYIQWNTNNNTGTLTLLKFKDALLNQFETQTGVQVVNNTWSEIRFNNWLLNLLKTNPGQLLTVEKTASINQTDLDYLYGNNTTSGKGLSEDGRNYILSLKDYGTPFTVPSAVVPSDNYQAFVNKGDEIAQHAKDVLTNLPGAYGNIAVSTAPVYATVGGVLIHGFYDGFASVIGTDPNDIISLGNPYNFDSYLNHYFNSVFYIKGTGGILYAIQAQYDTLTDTLTWSNPVDLSNGTGKPNGIPGISTDAGKNGNNQSYFTAGMGSMPWAVMGYLWTQNISYDIKKEWNCIGHCMSGPAILALNQYILSAFPLGPDEHYIQIGQLGYGLGNTVGLARTDAGTTNALNIYPGSGTFYTGNTGNATIIIRWNDKTNTGTVSIVTYDGTILTTLRKSEGSTTNSAVWYADVQSGKAATTQADIAKGFSVSDGITLTAEQLNEVLNSDDALKVLQDIEAKARSSSLTNNNGNQQDSTDKSGVSYGNSNTGDLTNGKSSSASNSGASSTGASSTGVSVGDIPTLSAISGAVAVASDSGQKSYEVSKTGANGGSSNSNPLTAAMGIIAIGILVGAGFLYRGGVFKK